MEKRKLGLGLAAAGPVLWGSSGTVAQNLFEHYDILPTWLATIRMIFVGQHNIKSRFQTQARQF